MRLRKTYIFLIGIVSLLMGQVMAKSLEKAIFNIENVEAIEAPFSKGVLFKPILHPNRQDGSAIDLEKGAPAIRHSTAQFTVKPGYAWPTTVFTIAEIYIITEGTGEINIDGAVHNIKKGDIIYVAPHLERAIRNNGKSDLVYLSITDPEWSPEAETQK